MRRQGVADNPVLVGAGAILVMLVMILLSYNATTGLPFVPTYDITAEVPNGAALVKGNEVRIGGARVGIVTSITPVNEEVDGKTSYHAKIALKLDKNIGPIPENSEVEVRPKSTIGLKYVELTLGDSPETIANGGNLPLSQATVAVEFEDLLNTFDKRVREGNKRSLQEFGDAFAGRGADLNVAFGELVPLFENLEPVARTVSDPAARLGDFIVALATTVDATAAAGDQFGEVFVNADRTFAAFAAASTGIQESLDESPSTLAVLTENFPAQRQYLRQLTVLVEKFQPGAPYLPEVSGNLAEITRNGPSAFDKLYRTTPAFDRTFTKLGQFAADEQVRLGLNGLTNFVQTINQPLKYITPSQTKCNYWGLLARNLASATSTRNNGDSFLRFGVVTGWTNPTPRQNAEVGPGNAPPAIDNVIGPNDDRSNRQQSNAYPTTGQNNVCGAGNEVTKGKNTNTGTPKLPKSVTLTQPGGIKSGDTTEDTESVGTDKVRTK
ncbi:MAG: MCE family protein [Thermoleophilaceae bacterium]|nr:MCE family protein [Thermoleophilaceae bacterium]